MTGKERIYNTLAGKKVDRIPIALICDSDYQCKAAGVDLCEFNLGNNNARVEIQQKFIERHKKKLLFYYLLIN